MKKCKVKRRKRKQWKRLMKLESKGFRRCEKKTAKKTNPDEEAQI